MFSFINKAVKYVYPVSALIQIACFSALAFMRQFNDNHEGDFDPYYEQMDTMLMASYAIMLAENLRKFCVFGERDDAEHEFTAEDDSIATILANFGDTATNIVGVIFSHDGFILNLNKAGLGKQLNPLFIMSIFNNVLQVGGYFHRESPDLISRLLMTAYYGAFLVAGNVSIGRTLGGFYIAGSAAAIAALPQVYSLAKSSFPCCFRPAKSAALDNAMDERMGLLDAP